MTESGPGTRVGPGRSEIVSTVVVVLLAALAVFALWPRGEPDRGPSVPAAAPAAASDAELAPLREAAALPPCPDATGAAPAPGPLAGLTLTCLGAPGELDVAVVTAGRTVLINLWASWCGPCREELPVLAEYAARPGAATVLLVDVDDDPRAALRLLAELDVALPSAHDPGTALRTALDVPPGLPYSAVARADGVVSLVDPPVPFATADDVAAAVALLDPS